MRNRTANLIAALLLAADAALLAYGATRHSPTIDEIGHMAAGLSHWHFGRFDLYRVNPPLVRLVATAPVALLEPKTDWRGYTPDAAARPEFPCGEHFISLNGQRSFWFFTVARWACLPFSLLGGFVCYRWAKELYGAAGGLLAATLWCFSPNVLAHGEMITPDVGGAAFGVLASFLFWRWLRRPDWMRATIAGMALGAAQLTKSTFVLFYGLWPLTWLVWIWTQAPRPAAESGGQPAPAPARVTRSAGQLFIITAISVYVINLGYAFEDSFRSLGEFPFLSETLTAPRDLTGGSESGRNRFAGSWLAALPVPLPANYVQGIDRQKLDFENGMPSYLRGKWKHRGWWYYYLYGLAIKVPLGTWALFVMAMAVRFAECRKRRRGGEDVTWRDEFVLLLPTVAMLAFVSSQTGFNHHLRYVLPLLPFVYVWIGRLLVPSARAHPLRRWAVAAALAWSVVSSLYYYPNTLSYFNELVGGPLGGRWHLLDSNIDWGQDMLNLKRWLDVHPASRPLGLAYFGHFDPRAAGVEFALPPVGPTGQPKKTLQSAASDSLGPLPGWYAVSLMALHGCVYGMPDGKGGKFGADRPYFIYFQRFEPVGRAGYSIYIYHLGIDEVNRARRDLGLRPLKAKDGGVTDAKRPGGAAQ